VSARPHAPGPPRLRRLIGSRIRAGTSSLAAPTTAPVRPGTSLPAAGVLAAARAAVPASVRAPARARILRGTAWRR